MNRGTVLAAIVLVFFSTWFNSVPICTSFGRAPEGYSSPVVADSNAVWVPDNYTTIQGAINAAEEGGTIFVRAGTYPEHLVVDKALSLVGETRYNTTIDGSGTGTVVRVTTNNVTLSNLTIQNGELGIWLWKSGNNIFAGNIVSNNSYGVYFSYSGNNALANNTVSNNFHGIYLLNSFNNDITGNAVFSNNPYGVYFSYSGNNVLANNIVSNNSYGVYFSYSGNNALANNTVSNSDNGIHLHSSGNNVLANNTVSNSSYGIYLYHSENNALSCNYLSNNPHGTYVGDSDNNVFSGNYVSNNQYGIYLYYSRDNIVVSNLALKNSYGVYLMGSNNNAFFHNNFVSNTEPPSSINSADSWDNGFEGNYWSDYEGTDTSLDGIGDTPYQIDENILDNYPLMAMFLQFNIVAKNQSYMIAAISNSTISDFQCYYALGTKTNAVSFKANVTENKSFWRVSIPHSLVEPPFTVGIDGNPPSCFKKVYANETHTWLYFAYDHLEREITITHTFPLEQLLLFQWTVFGLAIIIVILFSISVNYIRLFNKQKKVIEAYEREVGSFPVSHEERARMRLIKDVIEREEKLEEFKKKYGIKIQPACTLEDLMEKLGVQKKVNN